MTIILILTPLRYDFRNTTIYTYTHVICVCKCLPHAYTYPSCMHTLARVSARPHMHMFGPRCTCTHAHLQRSAPKYIKIYLPTYPPRLVTPLRNLRTAPYKFQNIHSIRGQYSRALSIRLLANPDARDSDRANARGIFSVSHRNPDIFQGFIIFKLACG